VQVAHLKAKKIRVDQQVKSAMAMAIIIPLRFIEESPFYT